MDLAPNHLYTQLSPPQPFPRSPIFHIIWYFRIHILYYMGWGNVQMKRYSHVSNFEHFSHAPVVNFFHTSINRDSNNVPFSCSVLLWDSYPVWGSALMKWTTFPLFSDFSRTSKSERSITIISGRPQILRGLLESLTVSITLEAVQNFQNIIIH